MTRLYHKGLHSVGSTDIQKVRHNTQVAVNKMIRDRDMGKPCISCGGMYALEAGHFRNSTSKTTTFHYANLNGQCASCNRFKGGVSYEYSVELDKRWGKGYAAFLAKLSRSIEPWSETEMHTLKDAAKRGARVYEACYTELRPTHFPKRRN